MYKDKKKMRQKKSPKRTPLEKSEQKYFGFVIFKRKWQEGVIDKWKNIYH